MTLAEKRREGQQELVFIASENVKTIEILNANSVKQAISD